MLRSIANADYGDKSDENFAALRLIRDHLEIANPLPWEPREVLELTSLADPEHRVSDPEGERRGHLERAFCCAILLRSGGDEGMLDYLCYENSTLVSLLDSLRVLGVCHLKAALRSIAFRAINYPATFSEKLLFIAALLWLVLRCQVGISMARKVASWFTAEGQRQASRSLDRYGETCFELDLRLHEEAWYSIAADLQILARCDKELQSLLEQIADAFRSGFVATEPCP